MQALRQTIEIPLHILVRPRAGDFVYSGQEFENMQAEIKGAKRMGMDGVVLGILDAQSNIDIARTRTLIEMARPLAVTFHRAFDACADLDAALEAVIATGADRILTAGGKPSAGDGTANLTRLVREARGRIAILPGGGIHAGNVAGILRTTGARELHSSLGMSHLQDTELAGVPAEEYEKKVREFLQVVETVLPQ
jgi:copper homeostasis protein